MSAGPTTAQLTVDDVQVAAETGTYSTIQLVFVIELAAYVIVVPPTADDPAKIWRPVYLTVEEYTTAIDDFRITREVPGIISTVDPYYSTPVIQTECGPVSFQDLNGVAAGGKLPWARQISSLDFAGHNWQTIYDMIEISPTEVALIGSQGTASQADLVVISTEPATLGDVLWTFTTPGSIAKICNAGIQFAGHMATDGAGSVYTYSYTYDWLIPAAYRAYALKFNSTGVVWQVEYSVSSGGLGATINPAGTRVIFSGGSGGTWAGGPANENCVLVNAATGAVLSTAAYNTDYGQSGADCHFCFSEDGAKLLVMNQLYGTNSIECRDVSGDDIAGAVLWTKVPADFRQGLSTKSRILRVPAPHGGWVFACTSAGFVDIIFLSEAGAIREVTIDMSAYGSSPQFDDINFDGSGRLWFKAHGNAFTSRYAYLDPPYTAEVDWQTYVQQTAGDWVIGDPTTCFIFTANGHIIEGLYRYPSTEASINIYKLRI